MSTFMVLLSIMMVFAQSLLGDVPVWRLWSNWALAGCASYVLWDSVDRYRLGRTVYRGSVIVPWLVLTSMVNLCSASFSLRFMMAENYVALICFLVMVRLSMSLWQQHRAMHTLVWEGLMIGSASAIFPGMLLWLLLVPVQLFFMRCRGIKNFTSVISGTILGMWTSFCILFFWGEEGSLEALGERYLDLLIVDWDLSLHSMWQWISIGVVLGMTILYCIVTVVLNVSNTLRAQSINYLLCVCQIMVLLFTLLDVSHLPVYLILQTMLLGMQLMVILANSRGYLSEWWTIFLLLCYMALSMGPYLPPSWIAEAKNLLLSC